MTERPPELNVLSEDIENRYRIAKILFWRVAPLSIVLVGVAGAASRIGIWLGEAEQLGRVLFALMALGGVSLLLPWAWPRKVMVPVVLFACWGRAIGLVAFSVDSLTFFNRLTAAGLWVGVGLIFLASIFQADTLHRFAQERGER